MILQKNSFLFVKQKSDWKIFVKISKNYLQNDKRCAKTDTIFEISDTEKKQNFQMSLSIQGAFQNKRDWAKIETTGALFW